MGKGINCSANVIYFEEKEYPVFLLSVYDWDQEFPPLMDLPLNGRYWGDFDGIEYYDGPGRFSLVVTAEKHDWTVWVRGLK